MFSKKIILICLGILITCSLRAQQLKNKNGVAILPQPKSWGISVSATPFLNYAGNMFSQKGNQAPGFAFTGVHPLSVSVLYVKSEKKIYRLNTRIGVSSVSRDTFVLIGGSNPNELKVANTEKKTISDIQLGAGVQKAIGSSRFQGYYGGEALLRYGSNKTSFKYGESLSDTVNPAFSNRVTLVRNGASTGIGVRGFIGAQYFFAPRMSVSAEYGWGFLFEATAKGEIREERWNTDSGSGEITKKITSLPKSSQFNLDNDTGYGALNLNFYF
ncbi:MAG: hypothetical protein IPO27_11825 [Bacteroidetes bacterium]|nr:hypothetical protein [Bacteroidota bacterium]